jgi:predicted RNA-binding Zn-ribbon protein involved in translation (DUF1610 family)
MRKETNVVVALLKQSRRTVCRSCGFQVRARGRLGDEGSCPRCGEWLVEHARQNQTPERVDQEPGTDFDESSEWEESLKDELG